MPKQVVPLTDTKVKNLKPRDRFFDTSDGNNLLIRVQPTGRKSWYYRAPVPGTNKRRPHLLGHYPAMTLKQARDKRDELAGHLANGKDLKAVELAEKAAIGDTFKEVATRWLDTLVEVSADHRGDIDRSLELHAYPALGSTPITQLTAPVAIQALQPLASAGKYETLRRICQRMNKVMTYALNTGLVVSNPLAGIADAFKKPVVAHQPTIAVDELPELMATIYNASIRVTTRHLMIFQLMTMTRPAEAAGAQWQEIDLETGLWTIPAERMKRNKVHIVPLAKPVLDLLERQRPLSGDAFVFPGDRDTRQAAHSQTVNMALKRMGYHGKLVSHGFRALASTALADVGEFEEHLIDHALAHSTGSNKRATQSFTAYMRSTYVEQRRPLMDWWASYMQQALVKGLQA